MKAIQNEELNDLYVPQNTIRVIRSRSDGRGMWYVQRRGEVRTGFWWSKPAGKGHLEDPNADGRKILKWIFKKLDGGVDSVDVLRIKQVADSCERGNKHSGSTKCGEFLD